MPTKPDRESRIAFAREFIIAHPSVGKDRVNKAVKAKYGVGLRRSYVASLKTETLIDRPRARTGRKSIEQLVTEQVLPKDISARVKESAVIAMGFDEAYHRLISAGFVPQEIRQTFGAPNAPALFGTKVFWGMLHARRNWIRGLRKQGKSKGDVIALIKQHYLTPKRDVFDFLRDEYPTTSTKPSAVAYREAQRKRARKKIKDLYRRR